MRIAIAALLLTTSLAGCFGDGSEPNRAPVARFKVSCDKLLCTLNATGSSDPDGDRLTYSYRWAGGAFTTQDPVAKVEVPASMGGDGGYKVSLVVKDARGLSAAVFADMKLGSGVQNAPHIVLATTPRLVRPGAELVLNASRTSDETPAAMRFEWIFGPRRNFPESPRGVPDPCATPDPSFHNLSTGCFGPGERSVAMDEPGTYNLHCHPHPWMQMRIVVDPALPAAPAAVDIEDFAYAPATLTVGKGSAVTFRNRDPTAHSATLLDYAPGLETVTGSVFKRVVAQAGEYVARLIVTDGHGGRSTITWGVEARADAPAQPEVVYENATQPLVPPNVHDIPLILQGTWRANLTLSWTDPTGRVVPGFELGRVTNGNFSPELECAVSRPAGTTTAYIDCTRSVAGNYTVRIGPNKAVTDPPALHDWRLVARSWMSLAPKFGNTCAMEMTEVGPAHGDHGC